MAKAPATARSRAEDRERVMRAAVRLARSRGYHGTSVDRLAAASGLPPDVVTSLFPDRVALLEQVLERAFDDWYREVPTWEVAAPMADLREELERRFARGVLAGRTSADFWHLGLVLHLEPDLHGRGGFGLYLEVRDRVLAALRDYWSRLMPQDLLDSGHDDGLLLLMASAHLALVDGATVAMQASPRWGLHELMSFVARGIAGAVRSGTLETDPGPADEPPRRRQPSPRPPGTIPRLVAHATLLAAHEHGPQALTFEVIADLAHCPVAEVARLAESPAALARETMRQGYEQWRDSVPSWQPIPPGGSMERELSTILRDTWRGLDVPDLLLGQLMLLQPGVLADASEPEDPLDVSPVLDARSTVVQLRDQAEDEFTAWFRQAIERDPTIGGQERGTDRLCARLVILAMDGFVLGRHLGSAVGPDDFRAMVVEVVMGALRS